MKRLALCGFLIAALMGFPACAVFATDIMSVGMPSIDPHRDALYGGTPWEAKKPEEPPSEKDKYQKIAREEFPSPQQEK